MVERKHLIAMFFFGIRHTGWLEGNPGEGKVMKKIGLLLLIMALGVWGCVTADNTTLIDADQQGYATGQFRDVHHGQVTDFSIFGGGAGVSAASSAASLAGGALLSSVSNGVGSSLNASRSISGSSGSSSGGGGGMLGLRVYPPQTQGDPLPFARSLAMINYSKRLRSIKYDESGGIIEYEFNNEPMPMTSEYAPPKAQEPSAFGHQPIE
jgi:hypothetical protein